MKTLKILVMAVLTILSVSVLAQDTSISKTKSRGEKTRTLYRCPMHPEVTSGQPGKCPKCGSLMALSAKEKMKMGVMKLYTCPMHPDETSDKPGKCPKCGMDMTKREKIIQTYSCPVHPGITSDKPGKCSKCGRNLSLSPKEKMKMEAMKLYVCPMHPDVTGNKPGKCPKCNMDLVEKKAGHSDHQQ